LTFKDLAFTASLSDGESKTILEPCSGHFEPGQLVAIMGPVLVNGHARDPVLFRRIAAYVGQEDHMPANWKVREPT